MNKQTQEALKMAIEAMSCISQSRGDPLLKAINACKEALEQPAQEPVAWVRTKNGEIDWDDDCLGMDKDSLIESACDPENKFNEYDAIPLYTHPAPQPAQEPDRTGMVYYKNNACKAKDAKSPDCICWTPKQPAQEPVAWTKTYEGKPYSNVLVFEKPENDPDGWYPLYLHPQEIWNDKVYIWQVWDEKLGTYYFDIDQKTARDIPLYTRPHQVVPTSTWQGLTDDEISNIFISEKVNGDATRFARAIEAKLKEKNT